MSCCVDFISIGTNDLSSDLNDFTFNEKLQSFIDKASKIASQKNKKLFLCGEIASDSKNFDLLQKLNIQNISVNLDLLY